MQRRCEFINDFIINLILQYLKQMIGHLTLDMCIYSRAIANRSDQQFSHFVGPLPVINDQSLIITCMVIEI